MLRRLRPFEFEIQLFWWALGTGGPDWPSRPEPRPRVFCALATARGVSRPGGTDAVCTDAPVPGENWSR